MQTPCIDYWNVVIPILRYLKKDAERGLLYKDKGDTQIPGYCDID